ncbi:GNAT family N-acetyltransferase [Siccirubricoccus sp. KC 17139]|uniref:GNAT family N-acetyltransferase n=1 Tax=Siccirubricoccus soli TaxID=2899147 RepID=A0ABT1DDV6_9PROT|nr:GNAT family N-acetyltransferase [Siccirubricoccus soli]MCO6419399.1 GNAT family N-acetyltransferase [Siccirubricoccus soli]MCP2685534.1 GNAT family N-acetyltransferase [Siccirubricoccus soli]
MALRAATLADVTAIRALTRDAYAKWIPLVGREPAPMTADYKAAVQAHRIDLWEESGELLALIETVLRDDHLWIENVAVAPARQGKGHGTALLAHAEALARAAGRGETRLLTNAAFTANIAFYERLGYAVTAREAFPGRGTAVFMAKRLAP